MLACITVDALYFFNVANGIGGSILNYCTVLCEISYFEPLWRITQYSTGMIN